MRFSTVFVIAFLALATAFASSGTTEIVQNIDGVKITRTVMTTGLDRTTYRTDAAAGTPVGGALSVVTIYVENTRAFTLKDFRLTEDLTWLPQGKEVLFSVTPNQNDGRIATWIAPTIAYGQKVEVSYRVEADLNQPQILGSLAMPKVEYAQVKAYLIAPTGLKQGQNAALTLTAADGKPIYNAKIMVDTPSGERLVLATDSNGRAQFTPQDAGFYTYAVDGYDVSFLPTTEVAEVVVQPSTPGAITPDAKGESALLGAIGAVWPIFAGLLLLLLVAFALYAYLNTSSEGAGDEPVQAAPPTRPVIENSEGGMNYRMSYGGAESGAQMKEQTRSLIEKRKLAGSESGADEGLKIEPKEIAETAAGAEAVAQAAAEFSGKKDDEHLPPWMKGSEYSGESAVVDDETIKRTIEELEQLRSQLRTRQEGGKGAEEEATDEEEELEPSAMERAPEKKMPHPTMKPGRIFPSKAKLKGKSAAKKAGR